MTPQQHTPQEELAIDSIHGLKAFSLYVDDAYHACVASAADSQLPEAAELMAQVHAVYTELTALIARYIKILDWGGEMSVDQAELVQQFYNQMLDAYDHLTQPVAVSPKVDLINQVETATFLLERGVSLLEAFSELKTTPLKTAAVMQGKAQYAQLQALCTDAKLIFDAIEGSVETTTLEDATMIATTQAQGLADINTQFDELEAQLTALFESGALEAVPAVPIRSPYKTTETPFTALIATVVSHPRYAQVVKEAFSSPSAFEAALRREVYRVEAPSKLDALLGVKHGSAFLFLKDMTLEAIDTLEATHDRESIRAILREKNIPYEIYMNWIDAIPYMETLVDTTNNTTFGELFVCSEVELLIDNVQ